MPRVLSQAALLVAIPVLFSGCLDEQGQFTYQRVADQCDTPWPVCDTIAGCILGDSSYISGQFPTTGQVIVSLQEPSTVTVSFFVENVAGAGSETNLYFFEDRCRSRIPIEIDGRTFVGEAEQASFVSRSADLSGVGDHLIQYQSDARLDFLMKVDVVPTRLQSMDGTGGGGSM